MRVLVFLLWALSTGLAAASPILVKSGEHDGFTRLVLDYGAPVDWTVGRTEDGYALRVDKADQGYDFSEAFRLIGHSRLAAIWTDTGTNDLRLGIACRCHAIPFEFRPGIVVIDLRDGEPPKGSSFEQRLAGAEAAKPGAETNGTERAPEGGYNWQVDALANLKGTAKSVATGDLIQGSMPDPALQGLRSSLLHELGRGATEGIIDVALPKDLQNPDPPQTGSSPVSARVSLGEMPGISVGSGLPEHAGLTESGGSCLPADALDLSSWGDSRPVSEQMAEANAGLVGEFDHVDPEALKKAIHFDLYIGFGAEARQLMRAFPSDLPDQPIWTSLSLLVEGQEDSNSSFIDQSSCDGPSALWAVLANSNLTKGSAVNRDAVFLAFSALPVPMRRNLGPILADRFLKLEDAEMAAKVRDAVLRAPGEDGPGVVLMEAKLDMTAGKPAEAEEKLAKLAEDSGPDSARAMIALAEAKAAQDQPIEAETVLALQAIGEEALDEEVRASVDHALILALAASGDFDAAFAGLPKSPDAEPDLWRLLSKIGDDDALLAHAVRSADAPTARIDRASSERLAQRLLGLGMADSALGWMPNESQADPILLAQIQLQRRDGRGAIRALIGSELPEAPPLRAQALQMLGDEKAAAQLLAEAGDSAGELRAVGLAEDWKTVSHRGAEPWKSVAQILVDNPPSPDPAQQTGGPLARGKDLTTAASDTRAKVEALLSAIAIP